MIYLIPGAAIFSMIVFVLFCILHCRTDYDRLIDDREQENFLRRFTEN